MGIDSKIFNQTDMVETQTRPSVAGRNQRGTGRRFPQVNQVATARSNVTNVAPTVNDDQEAGFSQWSQWIDTTGPDVWMCLDASTGAAVWVQLN
jgi:hypothetical protein